MFYASANLFYKYILSKNKTQVLLNNFISSSVKHIVLKCNLYATFHTSCKLSPSCELTAKRYEILL